jgi:hypothetical protein
MNDLNPYLEIARLVAASIVGALSGALVAHKLTVSRERASGRSNRRREFLGLVAEAKAQIELSDDPEFWVNYFTDKVAPTLKAEFEKISAELSDRDKMKMADAVVDIVTLSKTGGANINANKDKLLDAFTKFHDT